IDAYTLLTNRALPSVTVKWNTTLIRYYINPDGSGLSINQLQPAIQSAFDAWSIYTGRTFQYMGTTSAIGNANDHQNTVFWDRTGTFVSSKDALALSSVSYN